MTPLNCDECLLRQFDADCEEGNPMPADVMEHLASCNACRQEWQQQQRMGAALRQAMQTEVPAAVYRRAYQAAITEQETKPVDVRHWIRLLYSALGGAAAAHLWLIVPYTANWPWLAIAAFVAVAASLFLYDFYDECQLPPI